MAPPCWAKKNENNQGEVTQSYFTTKTANHNNETRFFFLSLKFVFFYYEVK